MGQGISVTTTATTTGLPPVALNPQQQQELRDAIEEASDEHLSEILQLLEDEGLSMDSPSAHDRSVASVRALELLRPGVVIVPLPIPQVPAGGLGGGVGAQPLPFPFFGLTPQPPQQQDDDDEDPYADMPPLAGSESDQPDPHEGMPPLVDSNPGGGGAATASLSTSPEQATPTLFSQFNQVSTASPTAADESDGEESDGSMPDLIPPKLIPTSSTTTQPPPPAPASIDGDTDDDDEFTGMPPLLPINPPDLPLTSSAPIASIISDGNESDSSDSMPPLAEIRPPKTTSQPPPRTNDGEDSDTDSMPDLVDSPTTSKPQPPVKPPSALDTFTFSSSFPSLLTVPASNFPLPALPPADQSPLRRSLASLPVDVLHAIGWFLVEGTGKDREGFERPRKQGREVARLSGCCRVWYGVLRKEMYRYLEIRGDDQTKAQLEWIKGNKEVASWVRYVEVTSLCPRHRDMITPIAEVVATFTNLTHFSWLAHASIPPTIASSLVKSPTLTSLHLWRNAIGTAYLLHNLNLVELKIARTTLGDEQCNELVDAGTGPLQGGTFEENELVYRMRDKRDLSSFRGLIEAYHGTLERISFESEFRSLTWMETVFGAPPPDPPTPSSTPPPILFTPPPPTVLSLLTLPRLRTIKFPSSDLTSPTFHHLLETSPEIESMHITHIPEEEGNEISPTAPEGTLRNLRTLHYRGGRRDAQAESFPVREGFESFLTAGGGATRVRDLDISFISPLDLQSILLSANCTALTKLAVSLKTAATKPLLQLIVRECPNLVDLTIDAPKWQVTLGVFSLLLRPLKNLRNLTTDHSIAMTTTKNPVPQAQDLLLGGVYPSEMAERLERYMRTNIKRWCANFLHFAEENHKLEKISWQASDEIVYIFTVFPNPPFLEEADRLNMFANALPNQSLIKRRLVRLEAEGIVELGAFNPNSLEGLLGGLAGLDGGAGVAALMNMLGLQVGAGGALGGLGVGVGAGAGGGAFQIPANLFAAAGAGGGGGGAINIPGLGALGAMFPLGGGFGFGVAGAGGGAGGGGGGGGGGGV